MPRYFTSILILLLLGMTFPLHAQDDDEEENKPVITDSVKQLRFSFDISKPILNALFKERQAYEIEIDYYHKKDIYFVAEGGWGSGKLDSTYLNYRSTNVFGKIGFNKSLLARLFPNDWDMAFIGLRYGLGIIQRSDATYVIKNDLWGNIMGSIPGKSMTAHWMEVNGGVRVELAKGLFAGWNIRGKFLLNGKQFKELPPPYIAGYGKGGKNSIFDFNFYLCYAIRWKK